MKIIGWSHDTWQKSIGMLLLTVGQLIAGTAGILFFGDLLHDAAVRPDPKPSLIWTYLVAVVFSALIMPFLGKWVIRAGKDGIGLGSRAKQAYEGKLVSTEETEGAPKTIDVKVVVPAQPEAPPSV